MTLEPDLSLTFKQDAPLGNDFNICIRCENTEFYVVRQLKNLTVKQAAKVVVEHNIPEPEGQEIDCSLI